MKKTRFLSVFVVIGIFGVLIIISLVLTCQNYGQEAKK